MYFADGNGANLSGEAYTASSDQITCVIPLTSTTSAAYFKTATGIDSVRFTHDNTATANPSPGHRCKDIARAIAEVANAGPHHTMVDMVDLDNSLFYSNLSFVTGIVITKNDQR